MRLGKVGKNTQNYKKGLNDPDYRGGAVTHLEPDIVECEVKGALRSIFTNNINGGDGIPAELFQILKDDAIKMLHWTCQQIWKTQQWPQDWKMSVFIPIPKKSNAQRMFKLLHNCTLFTRYQSNAQNPQSQASTACELRNPDIQAGFRKGKEPEI